MLLELAHITGIIRPVTTIVNARRKLIRVKRAIWHHEQFKGQNANIIQCLRQFQTQLFGFSQYG